MIVVVAMVVVVVAATAAVVVAVGSVVVVVAAASVVVAVIAEHRTVTPLTQVRFPGAARDCLPRVSFQCKLSFSVRTPPCAIVCINICAHVKEPVIHVRVRWIMETLKHPACSVDRVA